MHTLHALLYRVINLKKLKTGFEIYEIVYYYTATEE